MSLNIKTTQNQQKRALRRQGRAGGPADWVWSGDRAVGKEEASSTSQPKSFEPEIAFAILGLSP